MQEAAKKCGDRKKAGPTKKYDREEYRTDGCDHIKFPQAMQPREASICYIP